MEQPGHKYDASIRCKVSNRVIRKSVQSHRSFCTRLTFGSRPCLSSREMIFCMCGSLIIVSASGESMSTQCNTFRTPLLACWLCSLSTNQSRRETWANCAQFARLPWIMEAKKANWMRTQNRTLSRLIPNCRYNMHSEMSHDIKPTNNSIFPPGH